MKANDAVSDLARSKAARIVGTADASSSSSSAAAAVAVPFSRRLASLDQDCGVSSRAAIPFVHRPPVSSPLVRGPEEKCVDKAQQTRLAAPAVGTSLRQKIPQKSAASSAAVGSSADSTRSAGLNVVAATAGVGNSSAAAAVPTQTECHLCGKRFIAFRFLHKHLHVMHGMPLDPAICPPAPASCSQAPRATGPAAAAAAPGRVAVPTRSHFSQNRQRRR